MAKKRQALTFDGVVAWGDNILQDAISFEVNEELRTVTHEQGDGGGEIQWSVGRTVTGTINFKAINADTLVALTGGTATSNGYSRIRKGDETQTIESDEITLDQAGDTVANTVELHGGNGTVFKKVSSGPAVGEFSYASGTGVCTFNSEESENTIYPEYVYSDTSGTKVEIGKTDVPTQIALWGTLRAKNLNSTSTGNSTLGDMVIHLAKVNRTGALSLGGDNSDSTKEHSVEFSAIIEDSGDWEVFFPDN